MSKLNLGSGKDYREGWVNLEINRRFKADIYMDMMDYDPPPDSFEEIYAKDVLTHITHHECKTLLRRMYRWLRNNGTLIIHLPNFDHCARMALQGDMEAMCWIFGTDGTHADYATNHLKWGYTPKSFRRMLVDAGYTVLSEEMSCEGFAFLIIAMKRES